MIVSSCEIQFTGNKVKTFKFKLILLFIFNFEYRCRSQFQEIAKTIVLLRYIIIIDFTYSFFFVHVCAIECMGQCLCVWMCPCVILLQWTCQTITSHVDIFHFFFHIYIILQREYNELYGICHLHHRCTYIRQAVLFSFFFWPCRGNNSVFCSYRITCNLDFHSTRTLRTRGFKICTNCTQRPRRYSTGFNSS